MAIIIATLAGKGSGNMAYDIAMAVLGSALLGFMMSLIESSMTASRITSRTEAHRENRGEKYIAYREY